MTRRPLAVLLLGAVLREALPWLNRLADVMDPASNSPHAWEDRRPIPGERVFVPAAWVETDEHVHGAGCHPSADGCPDDIR